MHLKFNDLDKASAYRLLTHTVTPRPIAWVLTENENGSYNVAPFSYFTVISSDPALLMISAGHKADGSKKDTWRNIERTEQAVIHIADLSLIDALNETARPLPADVSELTNVDLPLCDEAGFELPRIQAAPVAFQTRLYDIHLVGNGPQGVIYTEVTHAYVNDELWLPDENRVDETRLNPLSRLGGERYSGLGPVHSRARPN
ncbi:flavin reductase family protein [Reinekea blandensis]|uniref:Conserved protein/domain typically associated with flavoprotein oxygenase, DIM6/NTAB family n=1 Tax=Reinekea blandensis MED297 TaxID=314283 RepID=A4BCN1_9GAMM|nr:flavin reductase family protein [Reinekea blandensis]EAR09963.1 Conserved protein/domain typically associated with flavoprotein oxygenase, DIM6/NTAB family [Reinekea sp. MED297] [Reinekea blandensis MED297]